MFDDDTPFDVGLPGYFSLFPILPVNRSARPGMIFLSVACCPLFSALIFAHQPPVVLVAIPLSAIFCE